MNDTFPLSDMSKQILAMPPQETLDLVSALIPEGYKIARDTLPEQVALILGGLKACIEELAEERKLNNERAEKIAEQEQLIEKLAGRACEAEGTLRKFPRDRDGMPIIPNQKYVTTDGLACHPRFIVDWSVSVRQDDRCRECTCQDVTRAAY